MVSTLADHLHLSVEALNEIGTVYAERFQAYAFPMLLPSGELAGIRLRNDQGKKWAVKGSKAGLFIPFNAIKRLSMDPFFVCEGPTDTAAALTLGIFAIGRPACLGQEKMVAEMVRTNRVRHTFICCDNDGPGVRGAARLAQSIPGKVTRFCPPTKDLREFVEIGGTKELLCSLLKNMI
jgi:phage/plasmid primase-like uncharacterized protein